MAWPFNSPGPASKEGSNLSSNKNSLDALCSPETYVSFLVLFLVITWVLRRLRSHQRAVEHDPQTEVAVATEPLTDWESLDKYRKQRLWPQMSAKMLEIVSSKNFAGEEKARQMYELYIVGRQLKMNPQSLVEILSHVLREYQDPYEVCGVLKKTESIVQKDELALAHCKLLRGQVILDVKEKFDDVETVLEEVRPLLEKKSSVDSTNVRRLAHLLASKWHLKRSEHAQSYHEALKYLGCTGVSNISPKECESLALTMVKSALVGKDVFDLGPLVEHPLLDVVKEMPEAWLFSLLRTINDGDVGQLSSFNSLLMRDPLLAENLQYLRSKTQLLGFIQLCSKPGADRSLREISVNIRIPEGKVEILLMTAISKGLLRGCIIPETGQVRVEWVKPHILHCKKLKTLMNHIDQWCDGIEIEKKTSVADMVGS